MFKKLFALSLVSGSAVVGYSWYDQEFRKLLEDNVPYAKEAFGSFFEYLPDKNEVTKMYVQFILKISIFHPIKLIYFVIILDLFSAIQLFEVFNVLNTKNSSSQPKVQ